MGVQFLQEVNRLCDKGKKYVRYSTDENVVSAKKSYLACWVSPHTLLRELLGRLRVARW